MTKFKKSIIFLILIVISLTMIFIKINMNYQGSNKSKINSLKKFNEKNYSIDEVNTFNIRNIENIDKKNCIVISQIDKSPIFSILHKNIFLDWKIVSSTVPGAINENTIIYTSAPEYELGFLIGSIEYSDKIKHIEINQKNATIIRLDNRLIYYTNISIKKLNENGKKYVPEVSFLYKDGSIVTKKGWYW